MHTDVRTKARIYLPGNPQIASTPPGAGGGLDQILPRSLGRDLPCCGFDVAFWVPKTPRPDIPIASAAQESEKPTGSLCGRRHWPGSRVSSSVNEDKAPLTGLCTQ